MKIHMPAGAAKIIQQLEQHGFDAYIVGGCVRDSILGRAPKDWDVTTEAKPEDMKRIFLHTVDTGIEHGTVTVLMGKEAYEVTTYRIDGNYTDSRHPDQVTFTDNLTEDLRRRDFTINAMAYNERRGLVDVFGGKEDLEKKVIRCVGCAIERFTEDALRILRAVRFSAQLDFTVEEETAAAAKTLGHRLQYISVERIATELVKLLESDHPERIRLAYELGLTKQFLPELTTLPQQVIDGICRVDGRKEWRLAMLFWELSAETVHAILRRLKFDNGTLRTVTGLRKYGALLGKLEEQEWAVRKAMNQVGEPLFGQLFVVWKAHLDAIGQTDTHWRQVRDIYETVTARRDCVSLKMLAVSGADLLAIGAETGKKLGQLLQALLDMVLEHPEWNRKDILLPLAEDLLKEELEETK